MKYGVELPLKKLATGRTEDDHFFFYILGIVTILFAIFPLFFTIRLKKYIHHSLSDPMPEYTPKVSLILPCKGLDPGFEKNIHALLTQKYPDYEAVFVTATKDDPAYLFLDALIKKKSYAVPMKLVVAGISQVRGQKINNMLHAIQNARKETEVFTFVDSDIRPPKEFLQNLVQPLQKKSIGVTTGIRWYLPEKKNLGSILQAIWAAGAYPLLIDQRHNFAWGGANAIKKEVFEKAGISALLSYSISDTFGITNGVKNIGLKVKFVPQCIVVSHENSSLVQTVEWTNRQTIISRVYSPAFWWAVFITYSFANTMLLVGILSLVSGFILFPKIILPSLIILSLIPFQMINAAMVISVVKKILEVHKKEIESLQWRFCIAAPLTSILIMINSIYSLTTNEITWRGVKYKLVSPTETKILD